MAERGEVFPITRGLYETDPNVPGYLLAGSIYGPSYISFEYALGYYGMIPEETFDLAPRATREFRFARGTWEIGPLTY